MFGVQGFQVKQNEQSPSQPVSLDSVTLWTPGWTGLRAAQSDGRCPCHSRGGNEVRLNVPSNANQCVILSFHKPETSKQLCQQLSEGDQALRATSEAFTICDTDTHQSPGAAPQPPPPSSCNYKTNYATK